ncbi:hypothetical protein [Fusobacterium varium]
MFYIREYYIDKHGVAKYRDLSKSKNRGIALKLFKELFPEKINNKKYIFYSIIPNSIKLSLITSLSKSGKKVITIEEE